jgi:AmmeMemoRadiSam system protein B
MVWVRLPTQAGAFYEGTPSSLREQITECFLHRLGPGGVPETQDKGPRRVIGVVCPHAGYMFSGPVAAHAYNELAVDGRPDTVVILGPNHAGYGSGLAVMNEGFWRTPLGDVAVDGKVANEIVRESKIVDVDDSAHRLEHSIEVQLPFLQFIYGSGFKIVPICFLMQDLDSSREVGEALARVLTGKNAVIVASSDLTHYEPREKASRKDRMVLDAVEQIDNIRLFSVIEEQHVTACGYGPIATLIVASKRLGVKEAKLLCYETSGDVIGDYSNVVGYAAVCFTK